jgi:hypothetical protein
VRRGKREKEQQQQQQQQRTALAALLFSLIHQTANKQGGTRRKEKFLA